MLFFFSSRRRHTRWTCDWSSDVCSSDLSGAESGRSAPAKDSRGKGGTIRNLEPPSGSGPDPPEPRGPPLTFQFKIAQGDHILFESTPTEIPSEDLVELLKLAPGSE